MLFASDLDNTLIHSYKVASPGDVCVELRDGKRLSFMHEEAHEALRHVFKRCIFVPITTRSLEQYQRLDLGVSPRYAVVAHGALLLENGEPDALWTKETRDMFPEKLPDICENEFICDVRRVQDLFIFAKVAQRESIAESVAHLRSITDSTKFEVFGLYNKVYVFPRGLDKGLALRRLKERLGAKTVICAGDSALDEPMLKLADIAISPDTLRSERFTRDVIIEVRRIFEHVHGETS